MSWYGLWRFIRAPLGVPPPPPSAGEEGVPPLVCPNDGEPLLPGPQDVLYCPYDGWQYVPTIE